MTKFSLCFSDVDNCCYLKLAGQNLVQNDTLIRFRQQLSRHMSFE